MEEVKRPYAKRIKPYLICGLILGFIVYNFVNFFIVYKVTTGEDISKLLLEEHTYKSYLQNFYKYIFTFSPIALLSGSLTFLCCMLGYTYNNDKGVYRLNEEHGSARYAT